MKIVFLKILGQKYLTKAFLIPNLGIFLILPSFAIRQIQECWYQYCFKVPAQKYPNKAFSVPNLEIFAFFLQNSAIRQIWGC